MCLEWLIDKGVSFDRDVPTDNGDINYHLTREGGHSHRRILHAADATGQAIQTTLVSQVKNHSRIRIFERYNAIDLVCQENASTGENQCNGAYVWNRNSEKVESIFAKKTILVFLVTFFIISDIEILKFTSFANITLAPTIFA